MEGQRPPTRVNNLFYPVFVIDLNLKVISYVKQVICKIVLNKRSRSLYFSPSIKERTVFVL